MSELTNLNVCKPFGAVCTVDSARPHWCHWLLSFRAHGVAAIREIGKTGGFEDFEIETNPSEVTSVSGQVVLHASCTSESYTRMYHQLIICLQILKCKKVILRSDTCGSWSWKLKRAYCAGDATLPLSGESTTWLHARHQDLSRSRILSPQIPRCLVAAWGPGEMFYNEFGPETSEIWMLFFHARTGRDRLEYSIWITCTGRQLLPCCFEVPYENRSFLLMQTFGAIKHHEKVSCRPGAPGDDLGNLGGFGAHRWDMRESEQVGVDEGNSGLEVVSKSRLFHHTIDTIIWMIQLKNLPVRSFWARSSLSASKHGTELDMSPVARGKPEES